MEEEKGGKEENDGDGGVWWVGGIGKGWGGKGRGQYIYQGFRGGVGVGA